MRAWYDTSDIEWRLIEPLLPNKPRAVPRVDDRRVINGIFYVLRAGSPWRDLRQRYGPLHDGLPKGISIADLAQKTNRQPRGGSWNGAISTLRSNALIREISWGVFALATLSSEAA